MNKWLVWGGLFALGYFLGTKGTLRPVIQRVQSATGMGLRDSQQVSGTETPRAEQGP